MNIILPPSKPDGEIAAISSKSAAHRLLICASLADKPTKIFCERSSKDIDATARCLCALGAKIEYSAPYFYVTPISKPVDGACLPCGESGSTLRFLLPVIPALGVSATFVMEGRLPKRPLSPLYEELAANGVSLSPQGANPFTVGGKLEGDTFKIRGDVSSQFISGLLFALCARGRGGKIEIIGQAESVPYISMTVDALRLFGADIKCTDKGYEISEAQRLTSCGEIAVEGDWSNAAFMLCMGALGKGKVTLAGVDLHSSQGDRAVVDILKSFGTNIQYEDGKLTVFGGAPLCGTDIDARQIPDLVPVLATLASVARGQTKIYGAARLRLKESDRIASVCQMLTALGADIKPTDDGLLVVGVNRLRGGTVQSANDHRIAMSAAVASAAADGEIKILGAECVSKSYPDFWSDIKSQLGIMQRSE